MERNQAVIIAETISNEDLATMFENAKNSITNWRKISAVNKGMTIGVTWNRLATDFDVSKTYHISAKTNMVWEFGEFLPPHVERFDPKPIKVHHEEPKFK